MTRSEFIQRAAAHYGDFPSAHQDDLVKKIVALADKVHTVAPFDENNESADAIVSLYDALEGIDKSLDLIARELPFAGRGT